MKYRIFFDQETTRHRYRFIDVICSNVNNISETMLHDYDVEIQISRVFSNDLNDIINKVITRGLDVPVGEFGRGHDRYLYRLLYESVSKNLDSFISQLQVSVSNVNEINLLEDVHKGDLNEPKEQVINAIRTIKKLVDDQWFTILYGEEVYIPKEQQEQIVQVLKRKIAEDLNLLEYSVYWNDNFIKAKLDCISGYIIKSSWHFGLKREDGYVCTDVSLWPKPVIKGEEVTWSLGYESFEPVIWFGLNNKKQIDCWSIYGTWEKYEDNNSVWFPLCETIEGNKLEILGFTKDECERISKMDECLPELDYEIVDSCPIYISEKDTPEDRIRRVNNFFLDQYNYAQTIELLGVKEEDISQGYYDNIADFKMLKKKLCKAFITYCMSHNNPKLIEFVKRLLSNMESFIKEKGVEDTFSFTIKGYMGKVSFYMDNSKVRISSSGLSGGYPYWDRIFYVNGETESDYDSYFSYDFDVFEYLNNKHDNVMLHIEEPDEFNDMGKYYG